MKTTKTKYLAYDRNRMYIGTFEDEEYAQRWADKHGGYIDRHDVEKEENRIYDDLLKDMARKEKAKEILSEIWNALAGNCEEWIEFEILKLAKKHGVEVE